MVAPSDFSIGTHIQRKTGRLKGPLFLDFYPNYFQMILKVLKIIYTQMNTSKVRGTSTKKTHFDAGTVHLVQFIIQTNKCTTYIYIY
jgi:hypothetical protein